MQRQLSQVIESFRLFYHAHRRPRSPQRSKARRALALRYLHGEASRIEFARDGRVYYGQVIDQVIRAVFVHGQYQTQHLKALMALLEGMVPGFGSRRVILNIGANIGDTAIALAGETGRDIVAFEPAPRAFEMLSRNVELNALGGRVRCIRSAVGEIDGSIDFAETGDTGQAEVVSSDGRQGYGDLDVPVIKVSMRRLDTLVAEAGLSPADVLMAWSDTQGYETSVIRSGTALWKAGTPIWLEVWPKGLDAHGGTEAFLAAAAEHFGGFWTADDLERGRSGVRPIIALRELTDRLRAAKPDQDDVLLVPHALL